MKQIQTISTWQDGQVKTANYLDLKIISDDLKTSALFYYELKNVSTNIDDVQNHKIIVNGNVPLDGQEYENWGTTVDVNTDAYNIVASKLNLTII